MAKSPGLDQLPNPPTGCELQCPQAPEDRHGPGYDNDTKGWVRGMPSAEAKPGFDKHKAGR